MGCRKDLSTKMDRLATSTCTGRTLFEVCILVSLVAYVGSKAKVSFGLDGAIGLWFHCLYEEQ